MLRKLDKLRVVPPEAQEEIKDLHITKQRMKGPSKLSSFAPGTQQTSLIWLLKQYLASYRFSMVPIHEHYLDQDPFRAS
jgi:hypothetical protein